MQDAYKRDPDAHLAHAVHQIQNANAHGDLHTKLQRGIDSHLDLTDRSSDLGGSGFGLGVFAGVRLTQKLRQGQHPSDPVQKLLETRTAPKSGSPEQCS